MTINFFAVLDTPLIGGIVPSPLTPLVFPDGALHIKGVEDETKFEAQVAYVQGLSHDELFLLAMWAEACEERHEKKILVLPYLPGARMDRGIPLGAAIYADFIEANVSPHQIITIDPHSEAALGFYPKGHTSVYPVHRIIMNEIQDATHGAQAQKYVGVIAPDKGAHDRAAAAARVMGVPVYTGGKTRDFATGKLTGFHMEDELPAEGKLLIVDDICDGGGTFIGLAEATGLPKNRLDLWVTHGIFSKGIGALIDHFGVIHTTDSFFGTGPYDAGLEREEGKAGTLKVHKIARYLMGEIRV